MAQSLAKIYVHLIFSTKERERTLPDEIRPELHAYMGGILKGLGCSAIEINTEPDHAHILFLLSRTEALSNVVGHLKKSSNDWLREQGPQLAQFFWQAGFGAFSVSQSQIADVRAYIRNQREHHRVRSFQEELRALLKAYEVEYEPIPTRGAPTDRRDTGSPLRQMPWERLRRTWDSLGSPLKRLRSSSERR